MNSAADFGCVLSKPQLQLSNYKITRYPNAQLTSPSFRGKLAFEPAFPRIAAGCRNKICSRNLCRGPSSALMLRPVTCAQILEQHLRDGFPLDLALDLVLNELVVRAARCYPCRRRCARTRPWRRDGLPRRHRTPRPRSRHPDQHARRSLRRLSRNSATPTFRRYRVRSSRRPRRFPPPGHSLHPHRSRL